GLIAIDYETTGRKPEREGHTIYTCAICFEGKTTVAFPIRENAELKKELGVLMANRHVRKIAANFKFEDRWTRAILGVRPKGWVWDTCLAAHILDNRSDITGLKFQAAVNAGVFDYGSSMKLFFDKAAPGEVKYGANRRNYISSAPLGDLLTYNGMDAALEFFIAKKQAEILGVTL
ncbi:MAG: hypothetical protein ABFD66_03155, partial [Smithella sp.]